MTRAFRPVAVNREVARVAGASFLDVVAARRHDRGRLEGSPLDTGRLKMLPAFGKKHVFAPIKGALFVRKNGFLDHRAQGNITAAFFRLGFIDFAAMKRAPDFDDPFGEIEVFRLQSQEL